MKKSTWRFSAKNSTIDFKVKYYKISSITGHFSKFWGDVTIDKDFTEVDIMVKLETTSINANNERINRKLKSRDCLHAEEFVTIEFVAINACKLSEGNIREISGLLTIKNIVTEITLVVNYSHVKKGTHYPVMVFGLFGCIKRQDFNLSMEDDKLDADIQLTAQIELSKTAVQHKKNKMS